MNGYQPKNGSLVKIRKLPRGGFGLEKRLPLENKEPPMPKFKNKNDSRIDQSILCYTCSNKDICKYQGDYLEQVVHIVDIYDGVFELGCNHYRHPKLIKIKERKYLQQEIDKILNNGDSNLIRE